ncbi:hypothetical protein [Ureibacillus aquaedulcis]|uniref:DUF4064 domain-containing protein n=1 Tax=Ureibacillus aquaedulcis TaxID=3058421 RepID=A0ABT8GMI0_9BACL|nr:hypothetical protein [Ureibacillus sp. BA0131]MDN4492623.1 hypothetical protein [Ureibacillus sp. BA0131]
MGVEVAIIWLTRRCFNIDKFVKWFLLSFIFGLLGLVAVFFVEDVARITGEMNRNILLVSILTVYFIIIFSLFSLGKANSKKAKSELIISAVFATVPLSALIINTLILIVYFVGK